MCFALSKIKVFVNLQSQAAKKETIAPNHRTTGGHHQNTSQGGVLWCKIIGNGSRNTKKLNSGSGDGLSDKPSG
jgi:hypothetical protein